MKRLLPFLFALVASAANAQQLPHFSQYMLNDYAENPAVGGKNPYFEAVSINRYQWIGITDAPRTYQLAIDGPLKNPHFGVGGQLFTDVVGPTRRTGCYLSYAYHLNLTEDIKLSFGLQGGILQYTVDGSKIQLADMTDNVLSSGLQTVVMPEFGAGVYLYNKKKWYVGFSVPEMVPTKLRFFDYMNNTTSVIAQHFVFMGGYTFPLGNVFSLQPTTIVRYVAPAPVQFDLGLRLIYRDKIWVGAAFRNLDAIISMLGYTYRENLTVGYAYDYSITNIQNYSSGSHELFLSIRFAAPKQK
ncbi:MAG: type IX secretion system membrane protein PorP/SprF [Bacteroidia bacterium]